MSSSSPMRGPVLKQSRYPLVDHVEGIRAQSFGRPAHGGEAYPVPPDPGDEEADGLLVRVITGDRHEPITQGVALLNYGLHSFGSSTMKKPHASTIANAVQL